MIVAGAVKGNITAEKLEIRSTGRVWGDVVVIAFSTEEGAFLRGQVRMEDKLELHLEDALRPQASEPAEPGSEVKLPQLSKGKKVAKGAQDGA